MGHRPLCNLITWQIKNFSWPNPAKTLQFASLSFDVSFQEIFSTLCSGGTLLLISEELRADAAGLLRFLQDASVERIFLPYVALQQLATAAVSRGVVPESLREVITAGEQLQITTEIVKLFSALKKCTLQNQYGPSESHVVTTYTLRGAASSWPALPAIGRPFDNLKIYISDQNLIPVPAGVPGEIHIGGLGLARGYLNRSDLTAEKFLPDPFTDVAGARLYKTGDRARYQPDGNIEFLGRIDHQTKIRGFRVEPKEIETVLREHPVVREAVVVADGVGADRRLIAYVVGAEDAAPSARDVRSFLRQKLPEHMVPRTVVFLDALPLNVNGKVERRALPAPADSLAEPDERFSAARTQTEEILAAIWAQVLKLGKVGMHDNFFDLGGHSLLATRVVSRVRELFEIDLPLRTLLEDPTVAGLAERIEEIRREHLRTPDLPIFPVARNRDLPLSFAQERLWFLDQLEPASAVYNLSSAWRLSGSLDLPALERSLSELLRRHEALRTTFSSFEGRPIQIISQTVTPTLSVIDLTHLGQALGEEEAQRLAGEEANRPFDLAHGPLFRATLIRLTEEKHELLLTMHHIVSDGWSMGVLYRELAVLYRAFSSGNSSPLADLPLQYGDFAVWQRAWLQREILEAQLSYWKKQLAGAPALLSLPTDWPRSATRSSRAAPLSLEVPNELTHGLKLLSRREDATLFMTLLAAFQILLHRHTGQEDIVVGSPIANRNRYEIEGLIGFFVNTLALRSQFSGSTTFKELLAQVRESALGAYAHQDLPFEKLVEEMHPERSLHHTPLVQVLFNMFNQEDSNLDLPGLRIERVSSSSVASKFDLTLYVRQHGNDLGLTLVYRSDLFSEQRMRSLLGQYRCVLEQIVASPEKPIELYSLVTSESRPLLPDPSVILDEPAQELVTQTFSIRVKLRPADPAISHGERTWSYAQLASCAEALAGRIAANGLASADVVAVYGEPSFGLIVAMLATLMAGGVLLPVDPALPVERKRRMLQESKAKWLLYVGARHPTDSWLEEHFVSGILFIDPQNAAALEPEIEKELRLTKLPVVKPDNPAYIFFTSGSTGVPKGVLGCHKGLSHFLRWQSETFAIGPGDRVAQLTALSFDAVLRDVFLPLTSGAVLCLPEIKDLHEPQGVLDWLEREKITVLHAVPSVARSWLTEQRVKVNLANLRWAFFMGEPLGDAFVGQWRAAFHNRAGIVNLYGPTETTLIKCFYRVPAVMDAGVQPIGGPIADTQILVLNKNNQLCGLNEPGEIVLRTPFRSFGYVNAPEETSRRFVKNPFRDDAEDLVYFTGDAGCYRPDGTVAILGRLDDQIKIHGVRVEPAEVAAMLAHHPLVQDCAVVGKKDEQDDWRLVAYVVGSAGEKVTTAQLCSYLLDQLPPAMVPSWFVFLPVLPLTANGKVDRQALPHPDLAGARQEEIYTPPRTKTENLVASVWAEVLRTNRVGISDNFFELGGHSLLATQIVSRLRKLLQVDLSLRALFENPTVASLSDHIEAIKRSAKNRSGGTDNYDEMEEVIL
jgi:amino acid adenylation domain-containing protein